MENLKSQLSKIMMTIESDRGSTELAFLSVKNLLEAIKALVYKNLDDFYKQLNILVLQIRAISPKTGIIDLYFTEIYDEIIKNKENLKEINEIYEFIEKKIVKIEKEINLSNKNITENGLKMIEKNDRILIHSPSSTVKLVLKEAIKKGIKFKIILALQSEDKNENMIMFLQKLNIDFITVPEFMLSHIEDKIDKMFVGGINFNSNYQFIVSTGINAIISEMKLAKKKIIMFISTKKFSLCEKDADEEPIVNRITLIESNNKKIKPYNRIKFSYDKVEVGFFDYIITEDGILTPEETKNIYEKKLKNSKN